MVKKELGKEVHPEFSIWELESDSIRVKRLMEAERKRREGISQRLAREIKRLQAMKRVRQ